MRTARLGFNDRNRGVAAAATAADDVAQRPGAARPVRRRRRAVDRLLAAGAGVPVALQPQFARPLAWYRCGGRLRPDGGAGERRHEPFGRRHRHLRGDGDRLHAAGARPAGAGRHRRRPGARSAAGGAQRLCHRQIRPQQLHRHIGDGEPLHRRHADPLQGAAVHHAAAGSRRLRHQRRRRRAVTADRRPCDRGGAVRALRLYPRSAGSCSPPAPIRAPPPCRAYGSGR